MNNIMKNNLIFFNFGMFFYFGGGMISEIINLKDNYKWYRKEQIIPSIMRITGLTFINAYNIYNIINYYF